MDVWLRKMRRIVQKNCSRFLQIVFHYVHIQMKLLCKVNKELTRNWNYKFFHCHWIRYCLNFPEILSNFSWSILRSNKQLIVTVNNYFLQLWIISLQIGEHNNKLSVCLELNTKLGSHEVVTTCWLIVLC